MCQPKTSEQNFYEMRVKLACLQHRPISMLTVLPKTKKINLEMWTSYQVKHFLEWFFKPSKPG